MMRVFLKPQELHSQLLTNEEEVNFTQKIIGEAPVVTHVHQRRITEMLNG